MKRICISIYFFTILIFLGSCSKQKPEDIAVEFYNYLNTNNFEKAKELATPSAQEFITKLEKIVKEYPESDTVQIQILDIQKKENPVEGDQAIVNYKFGKYKNAITLSYTDGNYKVLYTDELKTLRVITVNSIDFIDNFTKVNYEIYNMTYVGFRIRVRYLIGEAIPFDLKTKIAYVTEYKNRQGRPDDVMLLCGNPIKLEYNKLDMVRKHSWYNPDGIDARFDLYPRFDAEEDQKFRSFWKIKNDTWNEHYSVYDCKKVYAIEGIFQEALSIYRINLKDCIIMSEVDICK